MRVLLLHRSYWPEENAAAQLLVDLAESLAAAGHEVTVLTSGPGGTAQAARETRHGVAIRRLRGTRWARWGLAGKALDFLAFHLRMVGAALFTVRRGDAVIALTDPPLLGISAWLVARLGGARIYHWVHDIYPEIAVRLTGQAWLQVVAPLRNLAWRRSDGCVVLGSDMAAFVARTGVPPAKITVSPNWAPAGLEPQPATAADELRRAWGLADKFVVAYSGNLGRVHDLGPVLDVAARLAAEPGVAFVFVGGGAQRDSLAAAARDRGLANVHFHPAQPRRDLGRTLALGDLHLVTLRPGCPGLVFPSKLYGIAAVGRPVAFLGPADCEPARLVHAHGWGRAFTREDAGALAGFIRELRAQPAARQRLAEAAVGFHRGESGLRRSVQTWTRLLAQSA